jgi:methyl-accepting chemotaxis protein
MAVVASTPARSLLVGRVWLAVGVVGIVSAFVLGYGLWGFTGSAVETARDGIEVGNDLLAAASATAATVETVVSQAGTGLDAVEESLGEGAATLADVGELAADLGEVVSVDVPDSLDALRSTMPQVIATAGVIDGVMRTLRFVGVDYDPDAPLDDSLQELDSELAAIPEDLRARSQDFDAAARGIGEFAVSTARISGEIAQIRSSLEDSTAVVADYERTIADGYETLDRLEARVDASSCGFRLVIPLLALTLAAVHTVPLLLGYEIVSSHRDDGDTA